MVWGERRVCGREIGLGREIVFLERSERERFRREMDWEMEMDWGEVDWSGRWGGGGRMVGDGDGFGNGDGLGEAERLGGEGLWE